MVIKGKGEKFTKEDKRCKTTSNKPNCVSYEHVGNFVIKEKFKKKRNTA